MSEGDIKESDPSLRSNIRSPELLSSRGGSSAGFRQGIKPSYITSVAERKKSIWSTSSQRNVTVTVSADGNTIVRTKSILEASKSLIRTIVTTTTTNAELRRALSLSHNMDHLLRGEGGGFAIWLNPGVLSEISKTVVTVRKQRSSSSSSSSGSGSGVGQSTRAAADESVVSVSYSLLKGLNTSIVGPIDCLPLSQALFASLPPHSFSFSSSAGAAAGDGSTYYNNNSSSHGGGGGHSLDRSQSSVAAAAVDGGSSHAPLPTASSSVPNLGFHEDTHRKGSSLFGFGGGGSKKSEFSYRSSVGSSSKPKSAFSTAVGGVFSLGSGGSARDKVRQIEIDRERHARVMYMSAIYVCLCLRVCDRIFYTFCSEYIYLYICDVPSWLSPSLFSLLSSSLSMLHTV
jgi:hypothetical protein